METDSPAKDMITELAEYVLTVEQNIFQEAISYAQPLYHRVPFYNMDLTRRQAWINFQQFILNIDKRVDQNLETSVRKVWKNPDNQFSARI